MPATLTIRDETLGGTTPLHEWALEILTERVTVRELIRSRVYQEVQDYNRRQTAEFRGLIEPDGAERTLNGWRLKKPRTLDWQRQFETAVEAFGANQVLILVNDRQAEALDEEFEVRPDTVVTFLRLTPLVGGEAVAKKPSAADPVQLLDTLIKEDPFGRAGHDDVKLEATKVGKQILALDRDAQVQLVAAVAPRLADLDRRAAEFRAKSPTGVGGSQWEKIWKPRQTLALALRGLIRRKLPLSETTVTTLVDWIAGAEWVSNLLYPLAGVTALVESCAEGDGLSDRLQARVRRLIKTLRASDQKECRKCAERLEAVLDSGPRITLQPGEAWSDAALADLNALPASRRTAWVELLAHCQSAPAGTPPAKWRQRASELLTAVGADEFKRHVLRWFPLVDKPRTQPIERRYQREPDHSQLLLPAHVETLKGLALCCGLTEDRDLSRALTALAVSAYRKVPGRGPRAVMLGNAGVAALGMTPGREAIGQLALLKVKVKFGTAQIGIEKALTVAAEREGLPRDEIEELAVPAYGLEEVGVRRETFGDYTAELVVSGPTDVAVRWHKADGQPLKSVPAAVKKDHADDLKELQATVKDIQKMLPAQRERIDNLFLQQKRWPFPTWRERYLDHPLVGVLARRLLWQFTTGERTVDGIWHDGQLVGANDKPLKGLGPKSTVELWHPIGRPVEDVLVWRAWLERHEVRQPFKQAHREVYVLTDTERRTRVYSNRFAAHVLRQHQFHALCGLRGWANRLRLLVDDSYPPATRLLPQWGLRAEFWIEGLGDDYGRDTNDSGTFLYLSTDQVRFYPLAAAQRYAHAGGGGYGPHRRQVDADPLPVAAVPPLVFSEIMRDVDLFVGVASVGNDPTWADGGPDGRYRDYWHGYSFGELSATAQTRKALLERLIPRLKIAGRCSFADRFLVVQGDLRTYKIHLGSGNILMAPNDQYLCIVAKQSGTAGERVFLPFEGDPTLSVILSKAFLLAEDTKITDATITSQIQRG